MLRSRFDVVHTLKQPRSLFTVGSVALKLLRSEFACVLIACQQPVFFFYFILYLCVVYCHE